MTTIQFDVDKLYKENKYTLLAVYEILSEQEVSDTGVTHWQYFLECWEDGLLEEGIELILLMEGKKPAESLADRFISMGEAIKKRINE